MPAFLWHTFRSQRQVVRAPGFLGGRLLVDRHRAYWTLTAWEIEQAMKKFRGSAAHAQVMPRLARWCDEATYVHWIVEDQCIPEWSEASERLIAEGHISRVMFPSTNHASRRFPAPRLKPLIGQELRAPGGASS
jgi:hypothetical protein